MDIHQMHVLFRTLGQQQGLQLIRGILAESIDSFLNEAIIKLVKNILLNNTQPEKDVRTPQYTKVSSFNQLTTLFRTDSIDIQCSEDEGTINVSLDKEPLAITNIAVKYNDKVSAFDCRIIESERLHQTLLDYLNKASYEYPIISLTNSSKEPYEIEMYLSTGDNNKKVNKLLVSYIKFPAIVYYDEDNYGKEGDSSVPCDLPEHLHNQVVELAVRIWFESLGLTSERKSNENNNNK